MTVCGSTCYCKTIHNYGTVDNIVILNITLYALYTYNAVRLHSLNTPCVF